ncbi:hypothetical protein EVAR_19323_1 [Eumeta japonica]|uniref:Uncharacterized protein n=1 Tax=Eumeta variegata TaxID=151549 RepID=A0A4C1TRB4_EUMVA|nr:hypothetical protein EVAR_19323_1 [Eumeta japonica]
MSTHVEPRTDYGFQGTRDQATRSLNVESIRGVRGEIRTCPRCEDSPAAAAGVEAPAVTFHVRLPCHIPIAPPPSRARLPVFSSHIEVLEFGAVYVRLVLLVSAAVAAMTASGTDDLKFPPKDVARGGLIRFKDQLLSRSWSESNPVPVSAKATLSNTGAIDARTKRIINSLNEAVSMPAMQTKRLSRAPIARFARSNDKGPDVGVCSTSQTLAR